MQAVLVPRARGRRADVRERGPLVRVDLPGAVHPAGERVRVPLAVDGVQRRLRVVPPGASDVPRSPRPGQQLTVTRAGVWVRDAVEARCREARAHRWGPHADARGRAGGVQRGGDRERRLSLVRAIVADPCPGIGVWRVRRIFPWL